MSYPIVSPNPRVQAHYERCRAEGTSHNLAEIFATGITPYANTDNTFLEGHVNGSQFEGSPHIGDAYKREAEAAGVSIKGKVYLGGLARYPGDAEAWVASRGDVQRICETRGWGCRGAVNVKAANPDTPPDAVPLADDIVDSKVADILEHVPEREQKRVDVHDLREQVKEHYTPPWSKK